MRFLLLLLAFFIVVVAVVVVAVVVFCRLFTYSLFAAVLLFHIAFLNTFIRSIHIHTPSVACVRVATCIYIHIRKIE